MASVCLDMRRARENDLRSRYASSHPSGSGHHPSYYSEEEKQRRRQEWMLEQEKKREHERRKQIMIQQYEARRARELTLKNAHRSSHRAHTRSRSRSRSFSSNRSRDRKRTPSRSKSRNKSTRNRNRSRSRSRSRSSGHSRKQRVRCNVSKTLVMAKSAPIFKGPEISPIPLADLKKIKIDIHRQIPTTKPQPEKLERDIVNPEDIVIARKDGEGIIPIFDRPELKTAGISTPEVKELRTIISVENGKRRSSRKRSSSSSSSRSSNSRRRSSSSSPRRRRSRSPRRESRYKSSRYEKESHNSKYREHSRDRRNDDRPRSRDRHRLSEASSREDRHHGSSSRRHSSRHRSTSRDRHNSHRTTHSYERYESHSSRRVPPYMEPMQFPYYFTDYMRPIVIDPVMAMRAPMPYVRGRMPPMMGMGGPIRPNFPRFGPPDMIRPYGPPGLSHSRPRRL